MRAILRDPLALGIAAVISGLAIVAGACGANDDRGAGQRAEPSATVSNAGGSVSSSGSVAPNTFLTFDGDRYRLVELLQADLIDESSFQKAGQASEADIDQEDLTVYRKADDPDAVYTYTPATTPATESESAGEGIPALWYRWSLEPRQE